MNKQRNAYLLRTYGITEQQYLDILKSQSGGCGICGKTPKQEGRNLAVDHDHKRLVVRGLLCNFCNRRVIGRHTKPELFEAAARYLSQDTGFQVPLRKRKRKRKKKR